jgi:hypothetical protein
MDGNVSTIGITLDLEAMKQAGIAGATMFSISQGIPPGPVVFMSDRWRQMTSFAVKEAARLGLELGIHNCAGWSSSGGPWITAEHSMQVIAWSERNVHGPAVFDDLLPPLKAPRVYEKVPYSRDIAVFAFRTTAKRKTVVNDGRFLGRTAVIRKDDLSPDPSFVAGGPAIAIGHFLDLTSALGADGKLTWHVPNGDWTILRIGHISNGKSNHFAPPGGEGLEVDKLSREALDAHWAGMMAKVISDAGPLAGKALREVLIDSYEVGSQNWTPRFREEFQKRRGYDCLRWLPAVTGLTVESNEKTARFLWDFRRTIADLYADNYYGYFGELCHRAGMKFVAEPYGNGGFDDIQSGGMTDIPMGEFGSHGNGPIESVKLAASIGHVYGRPVIAAESFTAGEAQDGWRIDPFSIKAMGDLMFCRGVNRYVFHTYAHQPWRTLVPGMTMGPFGMHLGRTQTWWSEAAAWLQYVARCQYLLQEGTFVADALYFYGEGAPPIVKDRDRLAPNLPAGYDYDLCDSTVILKRLAVKNGRLALPGGMSYRILILPESRFMTPEVARKIRSLVAEGATVAGPKPEQSPSLTQYPACDEEVRRIAIDVWGNLDGKKLTERAFGKGRIIWGKPLDRIFAEWRMPPDFQVVGKSFGARTAYIHRRVEGAELYFVSNQRSEPAQLDLAFRVSGKTPELWHPDSGRMEPAPLFREERNRTIVSVRLDPVESVFVVFRQPAPKVHWTGFRGPASSSAYDLSKGPHGELIVTPWANGDFIGTTSSGARRRLTVPRVEQPTILTGPWTVRFPPNQGAPSDVTLPKLISWSEHASSGIRYFSGTATYVKDFELPASLLSGGNAPHAEDRVVILDLGHVKNFARVRINGKELAVLWKEPFHFDISNAVRKGTNHLEVAITNLWPNRLIGDEQLPSDVEWSGSKLKGWPAWMTNGSPRRNSGRLTFTTWKFYGKSSALLESGLLGPVSLRTSKRVVLPLPADGRH